MLNISYVITIFNVTMLLFKLWLLGDFRDESYQKAHHYSLSVNLDRASSLGQARTRERDFKENLLDHKSLGMSSDLTSEGRATQSILDQFK